MGYLFTADSQLGAGSKMLANDVARRTGGRYRIEQYPNGALGGELEMLEGVRLGHIDMAFVTNAPVASVIPEFGVFDIPFLFRDAKHAHAVLDGPLGDEYLAKFSDKGMVGLAWGENGMRHITNSKRPIKTLEDLKGLKMRVPQSEVMVAGFKALGVDAQPLARRGHEVDGEQVVDGQPVLAHQVPEAAAEGQPPDPRVADEPARRGEPAAGRRAVELAPQHAARRARRARLGVDRDGLHQRQVDHHAAVAHAMPSDRVAAAADRDDQVAFAREADRLDDVVGARAAGDERREAVDRAVPDAARLVVALLPSPHERSAKAPAQLVDLDEFGVDLGKRRHGV
jgi:hypothetical protein